MNRRGFFAAIGGAAGIAALPVKPEEPIHRIRPGEMFSLMPGETVTFGGVVYKCGSITFGMSSCDDAITAAKSASSGMPHVPSLSLVVSVLSP